MFSKILNFIFGKDPKIFNKKGEVQHDLGNKIWSDWQNRRLSDPELNWRNHTGTRGQGSKRQSHS